MSIGDTFKTGDICTVSGLYQNMTHDHPTDKQKKIPLAVGKPFPPCYGCNVAVTWKLIEYA